MSEDIVVMRWSIFNMFGEITQIDVKDGEDPIDVYAAMQGVTKILKKIGYTARTIIPCTFCGKKAKWSYVPGEEYYCDECVPRGCSCNSDLKEGIDIESEEAQNPENYVEKLDKQGRRYPCCEFFELDESAHSDREQLIFAWEVYKNYEDSLDFPRA